VQLSFDAPVLPGKAAKADVAPEEIWFINQ
jgi:hypothetical protein